MLRISFLFLSFLFLMSCNEIAPIEDLSEDSTKATQAMNKSLKQAIQLGEQSLAHQTLLLKNTCMDKPQFKPVYDVVEALPKKIQIVMQNTNDLIQKLESQASGPKDRKITTKIFVEEGEANVLKNSIDAAHQGLASLIDQLAEEAQNGREFSFRGGDATRLKGAIPLLPVSTDNLGEQVFAPLNMASAKAQLLKYQLDAINSANQIAMELSALTKQKSLVYDMFEVLAIPKNHCVQKGETYEADIMLGAYTSQAQFTVSVNGRNLPIKDGQAKFTEKAQAPGNHEYDVRITVKNPLTGTTESFKRTFQYNVSQ